jgi:uncharacterized membrane protein
MMPFITRFLYLAIGLVLSAISLRAALVGGDHKKARVAIAVCALAPLVYEGLAYAGLFKETYLRFENPPGLLLVAAAGIFTVWRVGKIPARVGKLRRPLVIFFVTLSLLLASLAVAAPEIGKKLDRMTILLGVDRSRSIQLVPNGQERIASELKLVEKGMHDDDRIGTVVFGSEAATEDPVRPKSDLAPPQRIEIGRDGTNLEAAIRHALAEIPADTAGRIVLLSDGVQTRGDAMSAAAAAVAADVPVDVVVLEQKNVPDVRVASVRTPAHADEGEPLDLRVVTSSAVPADVEVRVKRDGEIISKGNAHIEAGEDVLRVRETASEPGLHRYDVEVTALDPNTDQTPEDNSASSFVRVRGPALALVLEGDPGKGAGITKALESSGFRVAIQSTSGMPSDIGGLAGYDLVVLSDIPASDLATIQIDALASYVKDLGGGLLLLGGDKAFGPGGYARTPIEEVSPVGFDLKEEKRRASLAEVIAIDYSGSMGMKVGNQTKLALANEASARSASLLGPGDKLGVEHVDTAVAWTIPLGPVTDVNAIGAKIRAVDTGGGGIYTDIALEAAYAALGKETVNLKHVLLFADGDDAEQISGCRALVTTAAHSGITTSVISLGHGSDSAELEVLSKIGGGRFYLIDDATKLPAVFTQETILASKGAIKEDPFKAGPGSPMPATRGIDLATSPLLGGYVVTVPKNRATVGLVAQEGDPLMATWQVGIGHASAFMSDFKDKWGKNWLTWPDAVKMFGQLGRDTARKADDPRVRLESDSAGGTMHVRADVVGDDGRAQTFRRLSVHVAGPDGFSRDLTLEAVGAGRYASDIPLSRPGTYVATAKDEISGDAIATTGTVLTAGEELRPTGSDRALLSRIASMTGGKVRDTLAGAFDDRAARRFAYTPIGSALALCAALAMLLGVASRRLGSPEFARAAAERALVWRKESREAKARHAKEHALALKRAGDLERMNANLIATKLKSTTRARTDRGLGVIANAPQTPGKTGQSAVHPGPSQVQQNAPTAPPAPAARELTAAERLAQKRRERR